MKALISVLLFSVGIFHSSLAKPVPIPSFPGGPKALQNFIYHHLEYPPLALELGLEGKLIMQLSISEKGKIEAVKIVKGIGAGCDAEGLKMVYKMPDWIPANLDGQPVKTKVRIEIVFRMR